MEKQTFSQLNKVLFFVLLVFPIQILKKTSYNIDIQTFHNQIQIFSNFNILVFHGTLYRYNQKRERMSALLARKRYSIILDMLRKNDIVHTTELVETFHVSSETVRKDLDALQKRGLLRRVHGGAVTTEHPQEKTKHTETSYISLSTRNTQHMEQKQEIARCAAGTVREGQVIALDYGSTSQVLAQELCRRFEVLTIVTNSIPNALILSAKPGFTVILTGGIVHAEEHTLTNDFPSSILDHLHIDTFFLSVSGIDPEVGCTDQRLGEISMQNRIRAAASTVTVIADSSKFGKASLVRVCPVNEVHTIITDSGLSQEMQARIEETGVKLILV